jgi:hypothetical protein
MKRSAAIVLAVTAVMLMGLVFSTTAQAGSLNRPDAQPPYGLKIDGAVAGAKLVGVIEVKLSDLDEIPDGYGGSVVVFHTLEAVARLRSGNKLALFPGIATGNFNEARMADIQAAILDLLGPSIIGTFFPGQCYSSAQNTCKHIYLKSQEEFAQKTTADGVYVMVDITLAVK